MQSGLLSALSHLDPTLLRLVRSGWLRLDIRPDSTFQQGVTNNIYTFKKCISLMVYGLLTSKTAGLVITLIRHVPVRCCVKRVQQCRVVHLSDAVCPNHMVLGSRWGHSGTEGGRTCVTYFAEEGVFF